MDFIIGGMKDDLIRLKYIYFFHQNVIDVRTTTWYFIFGKNENYFKGKPVERQ